MQNEKEDYRMIEYYDEFSSRYEKGDHGTKYFRELLVFLISNQVPDNASVLDMGCGSGWLLKALDNKKRRLLGVDKSEGMLKRARHTSIEIKKRDVRDLKISEKFDVVVISNVLHNFGKEDQKKIIKEALYVLNHGGEIFIITPNCLSVFILRFAYRKMTKNYAPSLRNILFSQRNTETILKREGLSTSKRLFYIFPTLISLGINFKKFDKKHSIPSLLPLYGYILIHGRFSGIGGEKR